METPTLLCAALLKSISETISCVAGMGIGTGRFHTSTVKAMGSNSQCRLAIHVDDGLECLLF